MSKMLCSEFITYNDTLYKVYRQIPNGAIKENHIGDVREMWGCDKVLKTKNQNQDLYLFLIECPDAVIVVDSPAPTPLPSKDQ